MINSLLHLFIRLCIKDFYLCRKKKKCNSKQTAEAVFFYAQKCAERKEKDEFWTGNLYVAHDEYTASGFRRDYLNTRLRS